MKDLQINWNTCYYALWVTSFDLSGFKNIKTLFIREGSFPCVKRVKISGLNQLEGVMISGLENPSSIRFESEIVK